MTLHEVAHGLVANKLGDDTAYIAGRLTLNPLKHIDPFATVLLPIILTVVGLPPFGAAKPVPVNPLRLKYDEYGSALVAVAGPLTNLVLAFIAGLQLRADPPEFIAQILATFVLVNLAFAVFNLIPMPPLDGSRVLFAVAPDSLRNFMRTLERGGLMTIAVFIFFIFPLFQAPMINIIRNLFNLFTGSAL